MPKKNDSIELAVFLNTKVMNTIQYIKYIESIEMYYSRLSSYGNEYIRFTYIAYTNKEFKNLNEVKKVSIENTFREKPSYIFSLVKNPQRFEEKKIAYRIVEFKHLYTSLTSYAILQIENSTKNKISIKVEGIDHWPDLIYSENFLTRLLNEKEVYETLMHSSYKTDIYQYYDLKKLAIKSSLVYKTQKDEFVISDNEIVNLFDFKLDDIRYVLIRHNVSINIKGSISIEEITIHAFEMIKAIENEIEKVDNDSDYSPLSRLRQKYKYSQLIDYLWNSQPKERIKKKLANDFPIKKRDIVELSDGRLVVMDSIEYDEEKVVLNYSLLKNDLNIGIRKGKVTSDNIVSYLKYDDFNSFVYNGIPKKTVSLLKRWMRKRKIKFSKVSYDLY